MALDMTPEQKAIGQANFQRVVGHLAADQNAPAGPDRRRFMGGLIAAGAVAPVAASVYFGYRTTPTRPVRAALIGAGDQGGVLIGEHNPRYLEFVAYSDIRPTNQRRIFVGETGTSPRKGFNFHYGADANQRIRLVENYRDLLTDDNIEAVVIALPLNMHADVACEFLAAGKHVFCEKLMARTIPDCKRMIRAADQHNKLLAIGHQRHYSMLYAHASEVLRTGALGDIRHIRALWHRNNVRPRGSDEIQPGHLSHLPEAERAAERERSKYKDSWRQLIQPEDRAHWARLSGQNADLLRYFPDVERLVRWRLFDATGGGLMAELGSHQLDACSIFVNSLREMGLTEEQRRTLTPTRPLAVSGVGGKYFYDDEREVDDHVYCTFEFPGRNYNPQQMGNRTARKDVVVVTYSSINTNGFEPYGECVMGTKGTLVLETEQSVMLWNAEGRNTTATVTSSGGQPTVSSASGDAGPTPATDRRAADTGRVALGATPPSRGYREELEHFAFCIRMREQGTQQDQQRLVPRCDGRKAMADAIMALTANIAMRLNRRVEFQPDWYDVASNAGPETLLNG